MNLALIRTWDQALDFAAEEIALSRRASADGDDELAAELMESAARANFLAGRLLGNES